MLANANQEHALIFLMEDVEDQSHDHYVKIRAMLGMMTLMQIFLNASPSAAFLEKIQLGYLKRNARLRQAGLV